MKKIILSAAAMLFAVTIINAQETRPANDAREARPTDARPAQRSEVSPVNPQEIQNAHNQRLQEINKQYEEVYRRDLKINDEQIGQIRTLHTETFNRYNSIDPQYFENDEVYRTRVSEIMQIRDERMRSILTPDQYSQYNTNRSRYNEIDIQYFPSDINQRREMMISPAPAYEFQGNPDPRPIAPGHRPDQNPTNARPDTPSEVRPVSPDQGATPAETRPITPNQGTTPNETRPVVPTDRGTTTPQ